jgi:hypothetical protein
VIEKNEKLYLNNIKFDGRFTKLFPIIDVFEFKNV